LEKYLWQGMTRLMAVYDGGDNMLMRFEYADDRVPTAMTGAGIVYYLTYDQVGSLRILADAAGNIVKRIDYDSFGNVLYDSNPGFAVPLGFAGGLQDRDTGLVRFGFRDYDPDIGRWTAKDPILFSGRSSDVYGYCMSNPINYIDHFGLRNWGTAFGRAFDGLAGDAFGYGIDAFGMATDPSGDWAYYGGAVGGALGAVFGAALGTALLGPGFGTVAGTVIGGFVGGYFGGMMGGFLDSPCAGKLNYGEDEMIGEMQRRRRGTGA